MQPFPVALPRRCLLAFAAAAAFALPAQAQKTVEWRYGHMNPPNSAAGQQAQWLAEAIAKHTNGQVKVTVKNLSEFLGVAKVEPEEMLKHDQVGVATGLAALTTSATLLPRGETRTQPCISW